MAEEKKLKKPRVGKKAGAGTELPVETVDLLPVEERVVKTPAKRGRKKSVEKTAEGKQAVADKETATVPSVTEQIEQRKEEKQPAEVVITQEKAAKKTPAKREKKKQVTEEAPVQAVEEASKQEGKEEPQAAAPEKLAEKAEKKEKPTAKKKEKITLPTKAEKKDFVKKLVRESLKTQRKWSELVDLVSQAYKDAYPIPENDNLNDVKGRIGSVLHVMQEEGEIAVDGNMVCLISVLAQEKAEQMTAIDGNSGKEKSEEKTEETSTAVRKVEASAPATVIDLSSLFEKKKSVKKPEAATAKNAVEEVAKEKTEELNTTKLVKSVEAVNTEETASVKAEARAVVKPADKKLPERTGQVRHEAPTRRPGKGVKPDSLKDAFLKKLRSLGGNYFEYYAIYLLERYSRMNGRRLEGLRISGGEYDGGIDGELELTDRLGFRETIYVQAKNWEPTDERWWIGETILQQFIGAVTYRKVKEGKQHCRGMFITTSAFTAGAREMLEKMSDQFVGYDGDDLYETAKECQFGLIQDGKGNWKVDEELLSGKKSFFFML